VYTLFSIIPDTTGVEEKHICGGGVVCEKKAAPVQNTPDELRVGEVHLATIRFYVDTFWEMRIYHGQVLVITAQSIQKLTKKQFPDE
jgi:hypothetical protein